MAAPKERAGHSENDAENPRAPDQEESIEVPPHLRAGLLQAISDAAPEELDEALDVALAGCSGRRFAADARGERPAMQRAKDCRGQGLKVALARRPWL